MCVLTPPKPGGGPSEVGAGSRHHAGCARGRREKFSSKRIAKGLAIGEPWPCCTSSLYKLVSHILAPQVAGCIPGVHITGVYTHLGPSVVPFYPFLGEGSLPTGPRHSASENQLKLTCVLFLQVRLAAGVNERSHCICCAFHHIGFL